LAPSQQRSRPIVARRAIDDLVGVAGEAVQRVYVTPLGGGQQFGGKVVAAAMGAMKRSAIFVRAIKGGRVACRHLCHRSLPPSSFRLRYARTTHPICPIRRSAPDPEEAACESLPAEVGV
jgi:hypothetical protein